MDLPHKLKKGAKYTRSNDPGVIYTIDHVDSRVVALMSNKGIYCEISHDDFGRQFTRKIW